MIWAVPHPMWAMDTEAEGSDAVHGASNGPSAAGRSEEPPCPITMS
jgi:hypothetical protein